MKAKILAVILTTCVLFLNVFPPVVSASEPDIVVDSGELEIVVDSGELEIVVDSGEPELVPMAAAYCPGSSTNTSGSFSGYRYSYSSNAYIKYRLQHPDGRTIDIMSETNMSVALAREYMAVIEEMKNAEANVEAISDTLGIAIGIRSIWCKPNLPEEITNARNLTRRLPRRGNTAQSTLFRNY